MFSAKELQDLLSFNMVQPNRSNFPSPATPDFSTKCHYTLQIYTCNHKSFLPTHRITHVSACLYADTANLLTSDLSPSYPLNGNKHRCNNMASKPREVHVNELCSKCRPHTLGMGKKLRDFERLANSKGERGEVSGVNAFDSTSHQDGEGSADEIERGLKTLTLSETKTPSVPQFQPGPALTLTTQNISKIPANEPVVEQPSGSEHSTDTQGRDERWVDVCPSVASEEGTPGAGSETRGLLSRIFRPFGASIPDAIAQDKTVEGFKVEGEGSGKDVKAVGGRKDRGWVKVKDDPDWEIVSEEERKEASGAAEKN
jgi:hypothetical protein